MTGVPPTDIITRLVRSRQPNGYLWITCYNQRGEPCAHCGSYELYNMEAYILEVRRHFPYVMIDGSFDEDVTGA